MAHLDTAYKLGALQAQAIFEQEINKLSELQATPAPGPGAPIPGGPMPRPPVKNPPQNLLNLPPRGAGQTLPPGR